MTNQQIIVQQDCAGIGSNMTPVHNCADYMRGILSKCRKAYIVHGHQSYYDCGAAAFMEELQQQTHCEYHNYYAFSNNPKYEEVLFGVKDIQDFRPHIIIAIGGGSVIDMAKLIRFYAQLPEELIAIPTTSGTGAESTHFAVCYVEREKESIVTILPNKVVLMPEFTTHNSQYLTACTGFDAFAQAIALNFPYFAKLNMECMPDLYNGADYSRYSEKMQWLRRTLDIREQDIETYFRTFIKKLGLGYRQDSNVDTDIIAQSINIERAGNNPHLLTAEIITAAAKSILNN